MEGDSSHEEDLFSTSSEAGPSRLRAVATPIDIKGKGRFNGIESGDEAASGVKPQSLYTPSSFTPLRRSVIFSMEVPSNVGSDDEGGKVDADGLPPKRFVPTAPKAAPVSTEKEEGQIEDGEEEGNQSVLLLPDHVVFDDGDDDDADADESRREDDDIEGVVVLDDDKGKVSVEASLPTSD